MKYLLAIVAFLGLLVPLQASAKAPASWCADPHYVSTYEYPTGTYWQSQLSSYPGYYAAHNAFYLNRYGC